MGTISDIVGQVIPFLGKAISKARQLSAQRKESRAAFRLLFQFADELKHARHLFDDSTTWSILYLTEQLKNHFVADMNVRPKLDCISEKLRLICFLYNQYYLNLIGGSSQKWRRKYAAQVNSFLGICDSFSNTTKELNSIFRAHAAQLATYQAYYDDTATAIDKHFREAERVINSLHRLMPYLVYERVLARLKP